MNNDDNCCGKSQKPSVIVFRVFNVSFFELTFPKSLLINIHNNGFYTRVTNAILIGGRATKNTRNSMSHRGGLPESYLLFGSPIL